MSSLDLRILSSSPTLSQLVFGVKVDRFKKLAEKLEAVAEIITEDLIHLKVDQRSHDKLVFVGVSIAKDENND